ncbi:hypothetical protein [Paraoerskovia marina]|uniref:hypothetical protein n=1 Tax=Paraoerskovia marina TaxID=545619 RepID=UPI0006945152|nr:hypothetical protein [Paraoerskovia marina]
MSSSRSAGGSVLRVVGIGLGALLVLAVVLVGWLFYEVSVPDDGDRVAEQQAEATAEQIAEDLEPRYADPLGAENLAAQVVADGPDGVTVLGWDGDSGSDEGAAVEVAIRAEVRGSSGEFFDPGVSAGTSLTCWRFTVHAYEHDAEATRDEIDCPDDLGGAPAPEPTPLPSLDPNAEATVLAALDALPDDATPATAEAALREAFPEFVDVRADQGSDVLVATVGVLRARDCIVGVRHVGESAWRFSGFDRIQLEPGEGGCDPGLYLAPITTH